jgi:peptide-methionine (R)-S-oxide reductase
MQSRRTLLALLTGAIGAFTGYKLFRGDNVMAETIEETFEIQKTDAEWRRELDPMQYNVLRMHGTERPGSSPLNKEKRKGTFACAGCGTPLFASDTKFESGTGWPSFYKPLPGGVGTSADNTFFMRRTEVHCHRCGGHLGHVFEDGPQPTGLRYCMNGVAMKFVPAAEKPA